MLSPFEAFANRKRGTEDIRNLSEADVRRLVLYTPMPTYPQGARTAGQKGSGLFRVEFNPSGWAVNVTVLKSTGYQRLDGAAIETFRTWRIRPNTGCEGFIIPVTFRF